MRSQLIVAGLACGALGLGACGSSSSGMTSAGTSGARAAGHSSRARPTRVYRVRLSGAVQTPPGAPHASGAAIIAFHGDSSLCWRFTHLHGFTHATSAHIQSASDGRPGSAVVPLSKGPRLRHQGCVSISPNLTRSIWSQPRRYYVSIRSQKYPAGAVAGQL